MIVDPMDMIGVPLPNLWENYMVAMDQALIYSVAGEPLGAVFFSSVARMTLDRYFDEIERELCRASF